MPQPLRVRLTAATHRRLARPRFSAAGSRLAAMQHRDDAHARAETRRWMPIYNEQQSHQAIGNLPPMVFKRRWQE